MLHKSKLLIFLGSLIIVLYGASAAFYGKVVAKEDAYKELSVLIDVINRVEDDYVETPDMDNIQEGAMQGLIEALDPYSSFLSKAKYDAIQQRNGNGKADPGMVLSKRSEAIYVVSCDPNGPAARVGIRPGDYVVSIDGNPIEGKSTYEVHSLLHGMPGTTVLVEVYRSSRSRELEMELTLQVPSADSVSSSILDSNIGLLKITSLQNSSTEQIAIHLKKLISEGAEKIVLDLRDCADGESADGSGLANFFLSDGMIYYTQNRMGEIIDRVQAEPDRHITDMPVVVLINGSTASAAEIVAGALKDRNRAKIVGEKSFGVGSAQETIRLKSGAILLLTIVKFYTPEGKAIQDDTIRNAGIMPNIIVPDNETRQDLVVESYYDDQDEAKKYNQLRMRIEQIQMEKALEVLHETVMPAEQAA